MNIKKRYKSQPELHAGALNDILFILLFFFLIVSTLANPNVIPLTVPKAKSQSKAKQSVIVNIKPTGEYILNGKSVPFDQLKAAVEPFILKDTAQATIAINADKTVPLDNVVAVMRIAQELGAKSTLLVDPKQVPK
jgi:biopolymer transport protein ExbD